MKVLVTGATGLVGRPLVRRLLRNGHQVSILTRDPKRAARFMPARVSCQAWHPGKGSLAADALRGIDAVVHLAGEGVADVRWSAARKQAVLASRVDSTRAVVEAIAAMPGAERPRCLVSASAIGFYGDRGEFMVDENAEAGDGFLADVCVAWESEAQAAQRLGVRTSIVRVGIVLGTEGGALAKMLPPFRLGFGGRVGSGQQWMSWIHLDDLVELFAWAVENDSVSGVINGCAPEPVTNREFTDTLAAVLRRPALLPVPAAALRLALGEMAVLVLGGQRVQPRVTQALGFRYRYPKLNQALDALLVSSDHVLEREQWVAHPPAEVFRFFSDAHNLEKLTPDFLQFHVLGTSSPTLGNGTLIDYKLSLHGLPVRWQSRIDEWQPDKKFVDMQTKGPYSLWHHTHEFEPLNGGTLIRDRVRYRLPLGALGDLVAGTFVERDLEQIFDWRWQQIEQQFA